MSLPEPGYVSVAMAEWSGNGWQITRWRDGFLDVNSSDGYCSATVATTEVDALLSAIAAAARYVFTDQ